MAQHLNHILGDKLLKSTVEGRAPIGLPSPEVSSAVCCRKTCPTNVLVAGLTGLVKLYVCGHESTLTLFEDMFR